jgi:Tfp pilus assembly protein PilV
MNARFVLTRKPAHAQRGVTLFEALLALLVLASGVLAMSKLHHHLQAHADMARQRSEAVRIAQEDIESLRAVASLRAPADARSGDAFYERVETVTSSVEQLSGTRLNTVFHTTRQIDDGQSIRLKAAAVSVAWTARDGSTQRAALHSVIAGQSPALAGALTLGPSARTPTGAYARAPGIPFAARNLGDGRSVLKPTVMGTTAFVFDNVSGQVIERCTDVPSGVSTAQLTPGQLSHCSEAHGLWLSGTVRFSNANPPDPAAANDTPLDLALSVTPPRDAATALPWCGSEAQKTVLYRDITGLHREAVPLAAEPASLGLSGWSDLGERYVAYHCLVPATGNPLRWSGVSSVVPLGWTIGVTAVDRKVCRYAWDRDGSGTIDRNDEHPAVYTGVDRDLMQQNFLVIHGDLACPGTAARIEADAASIPTQIATVQHQP